MVVMAQQEAMAEVEAAVEADKAEVMVAAALVALD